MTTPIVATVRVSPDAPTLFTPSHARVAGAAHALRELGFEVRHQGRFGVTVAADAERFEAVFGVRLQAGTPFSGPVQTQAPGLSDRAVGLDMASPVTLF